MIRIAVVGEGHLAEATAAECAEWFEMCAPRDADLLWFCVDMPVNDNDESDPDWVMARLGDAIAFVRPGVPILISTQIPVGFIAKCEAEWPDHHFAAQPENIRKAHARADFHCQDRIVIGTRHAEDHALIYEVASRFCPDPDGILFMSPESAECVKHALNSWLALNITFANEIADLCPLVGADVEDVFRGFRSDRRMNHMTPNRPGGPITGGTLLRDVVVLRDIGAGPVIRSIKESNDARLTNDGASILPAVREFQKADSCGPDREGASDDSPKHTLMARYHASA